MKPEFVHEFVRGRSERTLLLLHGTGGDERDLIPIGRAPDANASLLSPRGKVLENGMPRFFRRLAEGVFDIEDLKLPTHELADFVTAAAQRYTIDSKQIIAVGYSNGANIAASVLLLRPQTFCAAILFRAVVLLIPETEPGLSSVRVWDRRGTIRSNYPRIGGGAAGSTSANRGSRCDHSICQNRARIDRQILTQRMNG